MEEEASITKVCYNGQFSLDLGWLEYDL